MARFRTKLTGRSTSKGLSSGLNRLDPQTRYALGYRPRRKSSVGGQMRSWVPGDHPRGRGGKFRKK